MKALIRSLLAASAVAAGALFLPATSSAQKPTPDAAEYRLGAGDVVRVSVYQNPDLLLEARISETGVISYPLLGSVKIGGVNVTQAEKIIADGLRNGNFVKQPQVSIMVLQVRGNQASVLGQVNRPGRFPIETADLRLTDLIAIAGGVSSSGADVVTVVGTRDGQPFRKEFDLPGLFSRGQPADNMRVLDGDTIYVDRAPMVFIYGEVQRPCALRLERGMTVMQALATGGGLTPRGTEKGIRVHRKGADGSVQVLQPAMDDSVQAGDVVYVRESLF